MQGNTMVTAAVAACLLAGCGAGDGSPVPTTTSASSSSTTPSTTTTSTTSSTTAAPTTDPALAAALDTLAARSRVLKSNDALDALRASSAAGTAAARKGLKAVREAAYPIETRSCSSVASGLALTRSGAGTATTAGARLTAAAATRRAQIAALRGAVVAVSKLASAQPSTGSPTPAEIGAAVKAAGEQAAAETTSLNAVVATVSDGATKAREMAANAAEISAKVC
jgi:hypothetical protein